MNNNISNNYNEEQKGSEEVKNTSVSCLHTFDILTNISNFIDAVIKNSREEIDFFLLSSFETIMENIKTKSFILDKIFNPLESNEDFSNKISIVVYGLNNAGNQYIEYANNTYIKATGLDSLEQIIELSKKGKLNEAIYECDELDNVIEKDSNLDRTGGYYNEIFQMKLTGRKLRWNTIVNDKYSGTVRIGMDVTGYENPDELYNFDRIRLEKDFNFNLNFNSLFKGILAIFINMPLIQKYINHPSISNYLYLLNDDKEILKELSKKGYKNRREINLFISEERGRFLIKILHLFIDKDILDKSELKKILDSSELRSGNKEIIENSLGELTKLISESLYTENIAKGIVGYFYGKNIFHPKVEEYIKKIVLNGNYRNDNIFKLDIDIQKCIDFIHALEKLEKLSVIGDIIVNEGPLLIYTDDRGFYNNRILDITGYKIQEINEMLNMGSFGSKIFGKDYEKFATSIEAGNNSKTTLELNTKNEGKASLIMEGYLLKIEDAINKILIGTISSPIISTYNPNSGGEDLESYFSKRIQTQQAIGSSGVVETGGENFKDLLDD